MYLLESLPIARQYVDYLVRRLLATGEKYDSHPVVDNCRPLTTIADHSNIASKHQNVGFLAYVRQPVYICDP